MSGVDRTADATCSASLPLVFPDQGALDFSDLVGLGLAFKAFAQRMDEKAEVRGTLL